MRALTVAPGRAGSGTVREVTDPTPTDGEILVLGHETVVEVAA